eukprot:IDg13407t1
MRREASHGLERNGACCGSSIRYAARSRAAETDGPTRRRRARRADGGARDACLGGSAGGKSGRQKGGVYMPQSRRALRTRQGKQRREMQTRVTGAAGRGCGVSSARARRRPQGAAARAQSGAEAARKEAAGAAGAAGAAAARCFRSTRVRFKARAFQSARARADVCRESAVRTAAP